MAPESGAGGVGVVLEQVDASGHAPGGQVGVGPGGEVGHGDLAGAVLGEQVGQAVALGGGVLGVGTHVEAGRHRLRGDHAAGLADRLGHGHSQSLEPEADPGTGPGAGDRRCRRGHGVRRHGGHGTGLRCGADEHGHCQGAGPDHDGAGAVDRKSVV